MRPRVKIAQSDADIEAVRQQCRDALAWELDTFPHLRDEILTHSEPSAWEAFLSELPVLYARDKGAMLLAEVGDIPSGCILYAEVEPGIAEVRRLFVQPSARGLGVGTALVESCLQHAKEDGNRSIRLTSARFFVAALKLYHKAGFRTCDAYYEMPPEIRKYAVFMERSL